MEVVNAGSFDTVMVVDDDERIRRAFLRPMLRGVQVICVGDIESAMDIIKGMSHLIAVVDMKLGKASGINLIREIKLRLPAAFAVLMSAYLSAEMTVWAMRAGADDVVAKPVGLREILYRLNSRAEPTDYEPTTVDQALWEHVQRVLSDCRGNVSLAAEKLGVYRSTLRRWLHRGTPCAPHG